MIYDFWDETHGFYGKCKGEEPEMSPLTGALGLPLFILTGVALMTSHLSYVS